MESNDAVYREIDRPQIQPSSYWVARKPTG